MRPLVWIGLKEGEFEGRGKKTEKKNYEKKLIYKTKKN